MIKFIDKRFALARWARPVFTAATLAAVVSCAAPSPEVLPQRNTKQIPQTDIAVDSKVILAAHNQIRRQLSLPELRWSNQMAAYATEWALYLSDDVGCNLQYRGSIGLPLHKNGLGENLYKESAVVRSDGSRELVDVDDRNVVIEWARESIDYDYVNNACAVNKTCDRYTQVVWRDSVVVGCGAASCGNRDQIWVCNYDPPGNFFKQRPY